MKTNEKETIKVNSKGVKTIKIAENKVVKANFYGVTPLIEKKDNVNHHILLLDVSGSMYSNIERLKEKVFETLETLKERANNYVSVLLYSSHGECYRILNAVKCDETSYRMANVKDIIEKELYVRSLTVISEPLENAIDITEQLANVCDKHHIVLFTDGCVVPCRWNYKEEEEKCYDLAALCKERGIFLSAIGFGNYYDRNFLRRLVEIAGTGSLNHIDEILDYHTTAIEMIDKVNDEIIIQVPIQNKDFFVCTNSQRYLEPTTIRSLKKNVENIIVVFDEELVIENKKYEIADIEVVDNTLNTLLYGLSLNHIMYEDVDNAEIVIAQTCDKAAYDMLSNCYSFAEKGQVINNLQDLIINEDKRYKEGRAEIKVMSIEDEPICLLEMLDIIMKDNTSTLLWDMSYKYKRIGEKTISKDDEFKFNYPKNGYAPIVNVTIGSSKLNINVKAEYLGQVENLETSIKMDAKIYREYALIKNGMINVDRIAAKLSDELKEKFKDIVKEIKIHNGEEICILDLTKIKATNKRMLKSISQQELATYLYDVEVLGAKQWAVKQVLKSVLDDAGIESIDCSDLSPAVIEARKLFRIDEKGIYKPAAVTKSNDGKFEVYQGIVQEWKIEKFPKKKEQEKYLDHYKSLVTTDVIETVNLLNDELSKVQIEKRRKENSINLVRISSGLQNKPVFMWENVIEKSKKVTDKVFNANMVIGEKMIVSTKTINNINIREDKYTLFIKTN